MTNGVRYTFKYWSGRRWLLIFHHLSSAERFEDRNDYRYSIERDRFSILSLINDKFKYDNVFEFHLEYPKYKVHWIQNDNPLSIDEQQVTDKVPGFELKNTYPDYNNVIDRFRFSGLALTTRPYDDIISCLLDGNAHTDGFYYAIGIVKNPQGGSYWASGFPGAKYAEESVSLWIRVSNKFGISTVKKRKIKVDFCFSTLFLSI